MQLVGERPLLLFVNISITDAVFYAGVFLCYQLSMQPHKTLQKAEGFYSENAF